MITQATGKEIIDNLTTSSVKLMFWTTIANNIRPKLIRGTASTIDI